VCALCAASFAFADDKKVEGKKGDEKGEMKKDEKKAEGKKEEAGEAAKKPMAIGAMPEVKKIVDALSGKWATDAEMTMPGAKPEKAKLSMECKKIALGAGVSCSMEGKTSMGPMAETCMIAHDPEGSGVHMMCVTSMGEVHDHKGKWKDDKTLEFEPLKATMEGKPITETVVMTMADAKTVSMTSTTTTANGDMVFSSTSKKK
jgi:hypothetical protein